MAEKEVLVFHSLEELAAFLNRCGGDVQITIRIEARPERENADGKEEGNVGAVFL